MKTDEMRCGYCQELCKRHPNEDCHITYKEVLHPLNNRLIGYEAMLDPKREQIARHV